MNKAETYKKALRHLQQAADLLNDIGDEFTDYDAKHFADQVNNVISHDDGEAGLWAFMKRQAIKPGAPFRI